MFSMPDLPPLPIWGAYTVFTLFHQAMTHHCAHFEGASKSMSLWLCGFATAGRVFKIVFLILFAWKVGIISTLFLMAGSFAVGASLWSFVRGGMYYVLSLGAFVALPILGIALFLFDWAPQ